MIDKKSLRSCSYQLKPRIELRIEINLQLRNENGDGRPARYRGVPIYDRSPGNNPSLLTILTTVDSTRV
jgi:hypothetical protein